MKYPDFYTKVHTIQLHDSLSHFLGAIENGNIEITYLDCVKLAGHSCPTVAGAYLMALKALEELYPVGLPERGNISIAMRDAEDEGVTGVVSNVISFILGANGIGGFKGIQGNFSRNNLVTFGNPIKDEVMFTRLDNNQSVSLSYDPSVIPADKKMMPLMVKNLNLTASDEEKKFFKVLWQERVSKILLSRELWDQMITIH